jgi:hypothetical protein
MTQFFEHTDHCAITANRVLNELSTLLNISNFDWEFEKDLNPLVEATIWKHNLKIPNNLNLCGRLDTCTKYWCVGGGKMFLIKMSELGDSYSVGYEELQISDKKLEIWNADEVFQILPNPTGVGTILVTSCGSKYASTYHPKFAMYEDWFSYNYQDSEMEVYNLWNDGDKTVEDIEISIETELFEIWKSNAIAVNNRLPQNVAYERETKFEKLLPSGEVEIFIVNQNN